MGGEWTSVSVSVPAVQQPDNVHHDPAGHQPDIVHHDPAGHQPDIVHHDPAGHQPVNHEAPLSANMNTNIPVITRQVVHLTTESIIKVSKI